MKLDSRITLFQGGWWGLERLEAIKFSLILVIWVWFPNPEIGNRINDSLSSIKTYSSNFSSSLHIFWHKNNKKIIPERISEFVNDGIEY